jgi:hypothetical protein
MIIISCNHFPLKLVLVREDNEKKKVVEEKYLARIGHTLSLVSYREE